MTGVPSGILVLPVHTGACQMLLGRCPLLPLGAVSGDQPTVFTGTSTEVLPPVRHQLSYKDDVLVAAGSQPGGPGLKVHTRPPMVGLVEVLPTDGGGEQHC